MKRILFLLLFLVVSGCNSTKVVPDAEKVITDTQDLVKDAQELKTDLTTTPASQVS